MQIKSKRGSGRRFVSVREQLSDRQHSLGLGRRKQCLPDVKRNSGIDPDESLLYLHSAVLSFIKEIYQKGISDEIAQQAKAIKPLIETQSFHSLDFWPVARAIAVLSFQKNGYQAYGMYFKSELDNHEVA